MSELTDLERLLQPDVPPRVGAGDASALSAGEGGFPPGVDLGVDTGLIDQWRNVVVRGFYNGEFARGDTSDIAVTEVGSGATVADYFASIKPSLPYWVVAASGGVIKRVADANAVSGFALECSATSTPQTNRVYQDIPVQTSRLGYVIKVVLNYANMTTGSDRFDLYASWRDASHGLLGSRKLIGFVNGAGTSGYVPFVISTYRADAPTHGIGAGPATAAYLRVELQTVHGTTSTFTAAFSEISAYASDLLLDQLTVPSVNSGTAFPAQPWTDDLFYRSDLKMEFVYDGFRWVSTQLFLATLQDDLDSPHGASFNARNTIPLLGGTDIWIEKLWTSFYVTGGTALSGSHKWDMLSFDIGGTVLINSGASDTFRRDVQTINALLGTTGFGPEASMITSFWTKTGTPGTLHARQTYSYRVVAT